MEKRRILIIALLISLGGCLPAQNTQPSYNLDYKVLKSLETRRTSFGEKSYTFLSNTLWVTPALPLAQGIKAAATGNKYLRYDALESTSALLLCTGITMGIKSLVARPRPYVTYADSLHAVRPAVSLSFPSGHSSTSFCLATSLALENPAWYVAVPAYLWASGVAFSRLYLGVHYPTDVLTGIAIGVGSSLLAHWGRLEREKALGIPHVKTLSIPLVINL